MDDLDQITRDGLGPGVGVRLRTASKSHRECFVSSDDTTGIREWMESQKREHGEADFVIESVDKNAEAIETLWSGSV